MSTGENRQLMVGAAAAVVVLGGGAFLWFGRAAPEPELPQVELVAADELPSGERIPEPQAPARAASAAAGMDPADAAAAARKNRRKPPVPTGVASVKEPRVRPPAAMSAVHEALIPLTEAFQGCFDTELLERKDARGRAVLMFSVADGELASDVSVELRAIPSIPLRDCFAKVTRGGDFSGIEGEVTVFWPLLMWADRGLTLQEPVGDDVE